MDIEIIEEEIIIIEEEMIDIEAVDSMIIEDIKIIK